MSEYLLVCGKDAADVVDALAAACALAQSDDAQVDIAVPAEYADIARLSLSVRRVIAVKPPKTPDFPKWEKPAAGNWKNKIFSAAKNLAAQTEDSFHQYRAIADDIRLVSYDAVVDFNASSFSIAVARAAKTEKIIGFARSPDAVAAAKFFYHDMRGVDDKLNRCRRYQELVALALEVPLVSTRWQWSNELPSAETVWSSLFRAAANPPQPRPPSPFLLLGGDIPPPFLHSLIDSGKPLVGDIQGAHFRPARPLTAAEILSLAKVAAAVIGDGLTTALAAATGGKTLYIGSEKTRQENAVLVTTPGELEKELTALLTPPAAPAAKENPPPAATGIRLRQ